MILRECSENNDAECQKVVNVFVVGSHLFVVTGTPNNVSCKHIIILNFSVINKYILVPYKKMHLKWLCMRCIKNNIACLCY